MIPFSLAGFADPISSWTHFGGALASLVGAPFLIWKGRGSSRRVTSLVIYSIGLIFLFSMSGTYHLLARGTAGRDVLQRLDHAGIWVLIASTFTPIHIILFRRHWRWSILSGIWTIAIAGLVLEIVFFTSFPEILLVSLFLGLGWIGAVSAYGFHKDYNDKSLRLLIGGALFYSVGAVIDFLNRPILIPGVMGSHELFHAFVIAGAASHWAFIYHWCSHPVHNTIHFQVRSLNGRVYARARGERIAIEAQSIDEAKLLIRDAVIKKYHATIKPVIHLRFHQEEILTC